MQQGARDFTTVWFQVSQRTLRVEAFVLPAPAAERGGEVYRQRPARNRGGRACTSPSIATVTWS